MKDEEKTKEQLLNELVRLRRRTSKLQELENQCRLARETLAKTNTFLRSILESSASISIISTDLQHNIVYWNTGAENIFGYRADEVINQQSIDILYSDDEAKKMMAKVGASVLKKKKGVSCEVKEITKSGNPRWISMTLTPRYSETGQVIGILGIGEDITKRKLAEEQLQHSLEKLHRMLEGVVHAMVFTVEIRDPYTAGHQRNVASLAVTIAKEMKLPKEQVQGIHMAGMIHDIGKVSVPGEILSKPGKLTEIQFDMIKSHSQVSYDILKDIEFPWPIAEVVLQHHERIDGSGYPQGLKGKDILLEAKILAVADVVEAMSSHRPYRPALGIDKALEEITKNKGVLYDPKVVDACLKLFAKKGFTFK